jgi:hypothetical protein
MLIMSAVAGAGVEAALVEGAAVVEVAELELLLPQAARVTAASARTGKIMRVRMGR